MSIVAAELINYLSANMPETDAATSGGAISTAGRPDLTQFSANGVAAVVSDGADVRTVTVTGRLATGVIDSEILTLDGTNEVVGAKIWERILKIVLSATSGTRTVSIKQGSGGTTRATIGINETTRRVLFYDSASDSSQKIRHEKVFWANTHGSLTLTNAAVTLTADPSSRIRIGCEAAIDGTQSIANRLAVPSSVTFVDDSVAQGVPGGNLPAGSEIGVWVEQTLPADAPAAKSTFTTQLSGSTV